MELLLSGDAMSQDALVAVKSGDTAMIHTLEAKIEVVKVLVNAISHSQMTRCQ